MNYLNTPNANPIRGRRRALSINSITKGQELAMDNSIDNLQNDINMINLKWHNILAVNSNPLELALSFLDNTSVGLGYRYAEFNQLEEEIGSHLQDVVNEHSQAFNDNVTSYGKTITSLTDAQDKTTNLMENFQYVTSLITKEKGNLNELNEKCSHFTDLITSLSLIEELLKIPESIEENIRLEEFKIVQNLMQRSFVILNNPSLKPLEQLKPIRQQIELQEHTLFESLINELNTLIYNRKDVMDLPLMKTISLQENEFSNLENYLYNVANIDIVQQSKQLNEPLLKFIEQINNNNLQDLNLIADKNNSSYWKLFNILSLLKGLNKLSSALAILLNRSKEEIHSIILKSTEKVRLEHPTLLKMVSENVLINQFGPSMKQVLILIMRECFWEIFLNLLTMVQFHRVIFEIVNVLQNSHSYKFDDIWTNVFKEITNLLSRYLYDPTLFVKNHENDAMAANNEQVEPERKYLQQIFSLESNIESMENVKNQTNDLKALLKDIFLGFTVTINTEIDSVYIHDDTYEQEESLIPPSVFNMKVILEPLLLFAQTCSNLIPLKFSSKLTPSLTFFNKYMNNKFLPRLQDTTKYTFDTTVGFNNPMAIETIDEAKSILKSSIDFQKMFTNIIHGFNASNNFRPDMVKIILGLLNEFYDYNRNLFKLILEDISNKKLGESILHKWLNNNELIKLENKIIINKNYQVVNDETIELYKLCPNFYRHSKEISELDHLTTFDNLIYLTNTICWIIEWLSPMAKTIDETDNDKAVQGNELLMDADTLRSKWAFFEYTDLDEWDKLDNKISLLLNESKLHQFEKILDGFKQLRFELLTLMRFDVRSRCIYRIGKMFRYTKNWQLNTASLQVDNNISMLIQQLKNIENKFNRQLMTTEKDIVFAGIDTVNSAAFIKGAQSINIINNNGVKKILRNINVSQHGIRNLYNEASDITLGHALTFYNLCMADEKTLIKQVRSGELSNFTQDELETVLRLQFSEEMSHQPKRTSLLNKGLASKRFEDALAEIKAICKAKPPVAP